MRNGADTLEKCLDALLQNHLAAVEILVVDDASTDRTREVVAAFRERIEEGKVPFRCFRLEEQLGPASARNLGLIKAANPYLLFVDADMVLPPQGLDWIRETLDLYSHLPQVAGVLGVYSEQIPWDDFFSNFKNLYTCFLYKVTETRSPYLHTPIFCVEKKVLEAAGGFESGLETAEDFRLGILLGSRGYRFIIDRRVQGTHLKRYSLGGILREDWRRMRDLRWIQRGRLAGEVERRFYYQAHRWTRLVSVLLPGPVLLLAALSPMNASFAAAALALLLLFYLCNFPFLVYCARRQGMIFALKSAGFLFFEMLWAEVALGLSVFLRVSV